MWQKCLKVDKWIWLRATCTLKLQWPPRTCAWWWFSHQVVSSSLWPYGLCRPGSSVHGILHAGTLEWVVISFSEHLHIIYQNVPYKFYGLKSKIWTSFDLSAKLSCCFFFFKIPSSKINNNYDAGFYLTVYSRDQQHLNHLETF